MNMNVKKLMAVSLLSLICSLDSSHAGQLEVVNIDVPETVKGIPMKASIMLMGASPNAEYTNFDIDLNSTKRMVSEDCDHENKAQVFQVPNYTYAEMIFSYQALNSADMYSVTPLSCRINMGLTNPEDINDKQLI